MPPQYAIGTRDWEQQDLAEKSELSRPTVQRMEELGVERSSAEKAETVQLTLPECLGCEA